MFDGVYFSTCGQYYFDEDTAARWESWFSEFLTHDDGTFIELMPEWRNLVRRVFGWLCLRGEVKTILRKFREVLMYLPRGCAKTTCAVGISLGLITIDDVVAAQVYLQATDASEAEYMMNTARGFISRNPDLQPLYEYRKDEDDHLFIVHLESQCELRFYAGKPKAIGKKPHAAFIDEVQKQKDGKIISSYRTGFAKRIGVRETNALLFQFGTAPEEEMEGSETPLHKLLTKARAVLDNPKKNPRFYVLMRETTEADDPHDPDHWAYVNIGFGISIDPDQFQTLYEEAKDDPELWQDFCRYNLNMKVQGSSAYMPLNRWDECYRDFALKDMIGKWYFGGLDFSHNDDMTAFGFDFPWWTQEKRIIKLPGEKEEKELDVMVARMYVLAYFFAPLAAIKASKTKEVKYDKWVEDGWLEECGKEVIDYAYIRSRFKQICEFLGLKPEETGYDPFHAGETTTYLADEDGFVLVPVNQRMRQLSQPTRTFKTMVQDGRLFHNGNPILRWNLKNARIVKDDKGNIQLSKALSKGQVQNIAKIDGLAALLNGTRCWMDKEPPMPSAYELRGLR